MTTTQTSDGACETSRTKSDPEIGMTDPNLAILAASLISSNLFFLYRVTTTMYKIFTTYKIEEKGKYKLLNLSSKGCFSYFERWKKSL